MNRPGSILWFDRSLLIALALTAVMYVVTVLVGGVQGEYIPQPAVLAIVLGALLARWRLGLGWSMTTVGMLIIATILFVLAEASLYPDGVPTIDQPGGDLSRICGVSTRVLAAPGRDAAGDRDGDDPSVQGRETPVSPGHRWGTYVGLIGRGSDHAHQRRLDDV